MDPASLVDWCYSCLCSLLIPSVTDKSVIFIKKQSFPHTAPTDDAFFSTGTELERVGVAGPNPGYWFGWGCRLLDRRGWGMTAAAMLSCRLWVWHFSAKTRKNGGRRGLCPWPLRCLSQLLSKRKERMLRGANMSRMEMCLKICVPFTDGVALYL